MSKTLIRGGKVLDGTCKHAAVADVLVVDDRIAEIAPYIEAGDAEVIHAAGKTVTPGFVDIHRHCDIAPLTDPSFGELELAQGITTAVGGNCGLAPLPSHPASRAEMYDFLAPITGEVPADMVFTGYGQYADALGAARLPLNLGFLAGAGAIKTAVKGFANTPYTQNELIQAAQWVQGAMQAGAVGVSLGIMYQPEVYSTAAELAEVVRPAAAYDALLTAHIRGEGDSLVESVDEVIDIGRRAGLRVNISHFKATGIHNWRGKIFTAIEHIEAARAKGEQVTADFYPYAGGSSMMQSLLPPSILGGSNNEMLRELATESGKARLRSEIYKDHPGWDNMTTSIGWDRILVSSVTKPAHEAYAGRPILEVAGELGYGDPADFVADLLVAEEGRVGIIVLSMSQDDVDDIARLPWTALISDALYGGGGNPHPRLYGSFPKLIREYVNERRVISLPQAVQKMTSMPAARIGLRNRGLLKAGYKADINVFDPMKLADKATYTNPRQLAVGMDYVLVNGSLAFKNGKAQERTSGKLLRNNL